MSIGPCPPAAGHDGYGFHWMLRRPTDPAPYTGATGHDGSPGLECVGPVGVGPKCGGRESGGPMREA